MKTEHLSTDTPAKTREDKLDKQLEDSFPTSDPPSHSPGAVGAPKNRESEPAGSGHPDVKAAHRKAKSGTTPETY
jgi:hypothetical protein